MSDSIETTAGAKGVYEYESRFGTKSIVRLAQRKYDSNKSFAVTMEIKEGDEAWAPYAALTVNIEPESDRFVGTTKAFVDTNNLGSSVVGWLEDNGIAKATGIEARSGYCTYPQVEFFDGVFVN